MSGGGTIAVVLAAGEGTRMASSLPKVLHSVGGRPMLGHVLATAAAAGAGRIAVVVGHGAEAVARYAEGFPGTACFVQAARRGTGDAVLAARAALAEDPGATAIVLCGDAPLVTDATIRAMAARLGAGADLVVAAFEPEVPTGYGRLIRDGDRVTAIVEERDATAEERKIGLCNAGIFAAPAGLLLDLLAAVGNDNAKGEFYLTDIVAIAAARGLATGFEVMDEADAQGVNDRRQLAACEATFQRRARAAAFAAGVTLVAPETVFFAHDTVLGRDVVVEPNVVFAPGVVVEEGAVIRAFSHLEGARVGAGSTVGPFARLRPGADLAEGTHVGNFVEIKNATVGAGAKINHLTYVGDARVGARANLGAGTITCNYDGVTKSLTEIGEGAFIGSNSALVAPVKIGDGAYVGSGSVITEDVPADALAIGRGRQVVKPGRAVELRSRGRKG